MLLSRTTAPQMRACSAAKPAQLLGSGQHQSHLLGLGELLGDAFLLQAFHQRGAEALDDRLGGRARA